MNCPHCNYTHGYAPVDGKWQTVKGNRGDFYKLPIKMEREESLGCPPSTVEVFGCPSCKKIFIN